MTGEHLARHVAEAADAWLRDPQDTEVYRRFVHATLAWRAHTRPTSPGVDDLGGPEEVDGLDEVGQGPEPTALADTVQSVFSELRARAAHAEGERAREAGDEAGTAHDED